MQFLNERQIILVLVDIDIPPSLPKVCSIQYLLQHYLDINSVPRRSFFEFLLYFATDELEKEKLQEFCSTEGQVNIIHTTIFPRGDDVSYSLYEN